MVDLNFNNLIARALEVAAIFHRGGARKGTDTPYIVHPVEAAMALQQNIDDEELIAATLLHDTLEDTKLKEEDLREIFNDRIADLVLGASEKLKDRDNKPWKIRKQHTIDYLKAADTEVQYIACADKLSNIRSMIRDYDKVGDELWDRFNSECKDQKWYYQNLVESLKNLEGEEIYRQFKLAVEYLF